jgi:hypothetical protein
MEVTTTYVFVQGLKIPRFELLTFLNSDLYLIRIRIRIYYPRQVQYAYSIYDLLYWHKLNDKKSGSAPGHPLILILHTD